MAQTLQPRGHRLPTDAQPSGCRLLLDKPGNPFQALLHLVGRHLYLVSAVGIAEMTADRFALAGVAETTIAGFALAGISIDFNLEEEHPGQWEFKWILFIQFGQERRSKFTRL